MNLTALLSGRWHDQVAADTDEWSDIDPVPHGAACSPEDDQCFCSKAPEWVSGLRSVHLAPRPVEWSRALPETSGFYLLRAPGAHRNTWRVLDIYRDRSGTWLASWENWGPKPVSALIGFEWSGPIREPS